MVIGDVTWRDVAEQHDSYAIAKTVFVQAGDADAVSWIDSELVGIDAEVERLYGEEGLEHSHEEHSH